uniref:Uncharacterized protein AlNc14C53G4137 n=1 Tax=Albugo laibachii Nc14 TaxID=890382 RepID=F0WBU6_9STRA|nr:conserved hypothetical protein [Albugo laibachii Nc14]|eukprot:CCA18623.1 conserved hypothetical protein [Albugo laibachii Nc14]
MSLAFLAKKSWHTANLRNVEKVWIAEQKHAAEGKKLDELRKNIEEERQLQELRELQAAHGDKKAAIERVEWMYEAPMEQQEKTTEEYLLGKKLKSEASGQQLSEGYGSLGNSNVTNSAYESFSRLNEDPMLQIKRQQKEMHKSILKNPVKMKRIKEKVENMLKDSKQRKEKKKKNVKSKRKKRNHSSGSDSEDKIKVDEKSRSSAIREKKRQRDEHRRSMETHKASTNRHKKQAHREVASRSRIGFSRSSNTNSRDHRRNLSRSQRAARRSSPSEEVDEYGRNRSKRESHCKSRRTISRSKDRGDRYSSQNSSTKYGLTDHSDAVQCDDIDRGSLGPNAKFVAKARAMKEKEEALRAHKLAKSAKKPGFIAMGTTQNAREMIQNAQEIESYRKKRATKYHEEIEHKETNCKSDRHFLKTLQETAYIKTSSTIGERIRRNVHYIQRDDTKGFLEKK